MSVRSRPPSRTFEVGPGTAGAATREGLLTAEHGVSSIDTSQVRAAELLARALDARTTTSDLGGGSDFAYIDFNATRTSVRNGARLVARRIGRDAVGVVPSTDAWSVESSCNPQHGIRGGGAPYGGDCLPQDTRGFLRTDVVGMDMPLLRSVVGVMVDVEGHCRPRGRGSRSSDRIGR